MPLVLGNDDGLDDSINSLESVISFGSSFLLSVAGLEGQVKNSA